MDRWNCKPIGETEFVNGVAAMSASGHYGDMRACAGIVSHADLRLGARVRDVLDAHMHFRRAAFVAFDFQRRGIRTFNSRPCGPIRASCSTRNGARDLRELGAAKPDVSTRCCFIPSSANWRTSRAHFRKPQSCSTTSACPIGLGPYATRRDEVFSQWKSSIAELGKCENVVVKLGGFGMHIFGFGFDKRPMPPLSAELAEIWKPYFETCLAAFGPKRSMFESNFPVDKISCSYKVIWNAFKRLAANFSASEKADLFHDTAARVYRLPST